MRTKTVTQTRYICENCGATYSSEDKIHSDAVTGQEYCDKCGKQVRLIDRDFYANYAEPEDIDFKYYKVHPDRIVATELELELDAEEYVRCVTELRQFYINKMDEFDEAYLQGKMRDYDTGLDK